MDLSNSTFKVPPAPLPQPSQAETLLFNDILEEKALALRTNMMEFLQVLPYRKFDIEFSNFLKHTKNMVLEGQRAGANISRLTNSSQIAPFNPRPSTSFQCRQSSTTMSLMSNRNSTFRAPESSFQPVEPYIPFKPARSVYLEPRITIPRIEPSSLASNHSRSLLATVMEVSHNGDVSRNTNKNTDHNSENVPLPVRSPSSHGYSNVTTNEDELVSNSQQNENLTNGSNSVESLLDGAGFKLIVGLPENYETTKNNASNHCNSRLQLLQNVEVFLSKWSVNVKTIKSSKSTSKTIIVLTGSLLRDDKVTVLEKHHDAGILESRKDLTLVKTTKGLYRLIGNIIGGYPNKLYLMCTTLCGIPKNWRKVAKDSLGIAKGTKNMSLNFTLDSPAGPIKPVEFSVKSKALNMSFTRNGTSYNCKKQTPQKTNGKRKKPTELDELESKRPKFQSAPIIASTPKRQPKQCMYDSPSQLLKIKLHQKMHNKASAKSTGRILNLTNDSINVTKKRQSLTKEQTRKFSKSKSSLTSQLSVNNKCCSQVSTNSSNGSVNHSKQSKEKTLKSSKQSKEKTVNSINKSSIRSQSIRSKDHYSTATSTASLHSFDPSKNNPLQKLSINFKDSSNNSKKSKHNTSGENTTESITKVVNHAKHKENMINNVSLLETELAQKTNNQGPKIVNKEKPNSKKVKVAAAKKNSNKNANKKKETHQSSSGGLFNDIDTGDSDIDFRMASPSKLSTISRGDCSRSETPPLLNNPWASIPLSTTSSNPPTPMSKSMEAKALKRVKAPKITLEEQLRNDKKINNMKRGSDFKASTKKINQMLEFGEDFNAN